MSRRVRRVLPVALGIVAAVTLLAVLTMSDDGVVGLVCIGVDQSAYDRCIAELPVRQAQHDEDIRAGTERRPLVALAGGMIVAMVAHLIARSRTSKHPPGDDDRRVSPKPGDIGAR